MNIAALKAYNNSVNNVNESIVSKSSKSVAAKTNNDSNLSSDTNLNDSNNLVTKKERDFFIKMFPANSAQLEKHVLFNRSGKIQANNLTKGVIVDGRV